MTDSKANEFPVTSKGKAVEHAPGCPAKGGIGSKFGNVDCACRVIDAMVEAVWAPAARLHCRLPFGRRQMPHDRCPGTPAPRAREARK